MYFNLPPQWGRWLWQRRLVMVGHQWTSVTLAWWIGSFRAQQKERKEWFKSAREIIVEGLCGFILDRDRILNCNVAGSRASNSAVVIFHFMLIVWLIVFHFIIPKGGSRIFIFNKHCHLSSTAFDCFFFYFSLCQASFSQFFPCALFAVFTVDVPRLALH